MRVAFVTHYYPPETNAPAIRIASFARHLAARGHHVDVITNHPHYPHGKVYEGYAGHRYAREIDNGVHLHRVPTFPAANRDVVRRSMSFATAPMAQALWGVARARPVDVVVGTSPQLMTAVAAAGLARAVGAPFVLDLRDLWPDSIVGVGALKDGWTIAALRRVERWLYREARHILVTAPNYVEHVGTTAGVVRDRVTYLPNGVDRDWVRDAPAGESLRATHGIPGDAPLLVYCGNVGMAQGLEVIPQALAMEAGRSAHAVVIGTGAEHPTLARARDALGVAERLHLRSSVAHDAVPSYLAQADACLVHLRDTPALRTAVPSKLFEAMAVGRPVLLGARGDAAAVLAEARAGVVFTPEDAGGLSAALARLAHEPARAGTLGRNGRAFVDAHHDRAVLAARLERVLGGLCNSGAQAA